MPMKPTAARPPSRRILKLPDWSGARSTSACALFSSRSPRVDFRLGKNWLSEYMTGKNSKGAALDRQRLNERFQSIFDALRRAELPTEAPTAEEMAAAATAAAETAAAEAAASKPKPAKPSATNPVFTAAPTPQAA
eukprot:5062681-Prymnesium_polylepis.1